MSDFPSEPSPGAAILTAAEFEEAVTPMVPKLRANARRLTGNAVDGEDLVQDTLLRAWRARGAFEPGTNLNAWLFRIQRNRFLTGLRRTRLWVDLDARVADTMSAEQPTQEGFLTQVDIKRALVALPTHHREAVLSVSAGESYTEAASRLRISVNTLKSRLNRARAKLRDGADAEREPGFPAITVCESAGSKPTTGREGPGKRNAIYDAWKLAGSKMIG